MKTSNSFLFIFLIILLSSLRPSQSQNHSDFLQCLSLRLPNATGTPISGIVYTPNTTSFSSILQSSIRNKRFTSTSSPKPQVIVTPTQESQVPAVIRCAKDAGIQVRIRSGGHDYEGISYRSKLPFVILDMINLSDVTIDVAKRTAWVQSGATIGQLYYKISQKSRTLAFPAGACPTVGTGGHFSGGGYGPLLRKFGLAADNIVDLRLVDVEGRILDRKTMGEDLFWAARGGGGTSFGVVTAWKLKLVTVPETVTLFSVTRTLEQNATELFFKWQYTAPFISKDIMISVAIRGVNSSSTGKKTVQASFNSLFLGKIDSLLPLLEKSFPELGVRREDCVEASWIQLALSFGGYSIDQSPAILASRSPSIPSALPNTRFAFKAKIDYVQKPIGIAGIEGMWKILLDRDVGRAGLLVVPLGGRMAEIDESSIPFPHRAGNLYKIQQLAYWDEGEAEAEVAAVAWVRRFYDYLTPYVSKSPRGSYVNYRDLDLGVNNEEGETSYAEASVWGLKYFKNNFGKLVRIKSRVDPINFFKNEQSIPVVKY